MKINALNELTIQFFHRPSEVLRILKAYKSESFRFVRPFVANHFGSLKGREFAEDAGEYFVSYIVTQVSTKNTEII